MKAAELSTSKSEVHAAQMRVHVPPAKAVEHALKAVKQSNFLWSAVLAAEAFVDVLEAESS